MLEGSWICQWPDGLSKILADFKVSIAPCKSDEIENRCFKFALKETLIYDCLSHD